MDDERPTVSTASPAGEPTRRYDLPRLGLLVGLLVVSLPFLMMSVMMMGMGWMGPPMQAQMGGPFPGFFPLVGFVGFLVVVGVLYGTFRLSGAARARV